MQTKNLWKNWAETIFVPVAPDAAFKKCCMGSGAYDGSNRNYFFPRVARIVGPIAAGHIGLT
jgi:hypothetical protein